MVGIVVVSHSAKLAAGVMELARGMAGPAVKIAAAGGLDMPESPLGTDAVFVLRAIEEVYSDDGVLVLVDMGSAILSAELAVDMLPPERGAKVRLCSAPIVEGSVTAALQARLGQTLAEVAHEALRALDMKRAQLPETESFSGTPAIGPQQDRAEHEICLPVHNPHGLHARPAARILQTAARFQARIHLSNLTTGRGPVDTRSINDLMMLNVLQGHQLQACASGPEALEALEALQFLAATDFGDGDGAAADARVGPDMTAKMTGPDAAGGAQALIGAAGAPNERFQGAPVSRGIAIGPARLLRAAAPDIPSHKASDAQAEWERLIAALDKAQQEIEWERRNISSRLDGHAAPLFDAHLFLLQDHSLRMSARRAIFDSGHNGVLAWYLVVEQAAAEYAALGNEYLQARSADVKEVGRRVLLNLLGHAVTGGGFDEPGILVAADLGLGEIAQLDPTVVLGVCTGKGGAASHSAILVNSLGIPAVMGLGDEVLTIKEGVTVIVDGDKGIVIADPPFEVLDEYRKRFEALRAAQDRARRASLAPAFTRDGRRVEVAANIGSTAEAKTAASNGADGVGLYRTEFLFLARQGAPDEEEQFLAYREAALVLAKRALIVRTLDIGGDKALPYLKLEEEANPFLGLRGLRLTLKHRDLFKTQLCAILRAAAQFPIRIMFPMVTTPAEWREAITVLSEARSDVAGRGLPVPARIETGMMVEVPGAALQAEQFAPLVDFFSIGSNDLTQYTLAAERGNPSVAALSDSLHPAVLRLIQHVVDVAHSHGKWVGICGELAGDADAAPVLVGLGIDELSMNGTGIPLIKQLIRTLDFSVVQALAKASLALETAADVRALLKSGLELKSDSGIY
jgi:phosphoenolpyruvate-protein phosphotransferase/dihydroxyacetone kinase phosphotransfer subunit